MDSEDEGHDDHENDIEIESQEDPNLDPIPIANKRPKWDQKLIKATGNITGDLDDKRRTRSQYQNEHVALSYKISLPSVWCNKLPERCYMMVRTD